MAAKLYKTMSKHMWNVVHRCLLERAEATLRAPLTSVAYPSSSCLVRSHVPQHGTLIRLLSWSSEALTRTGRKTKRRHDDGDGSLESRIIHNMTLAHIHYDESNFERARQILDETLIMCRKADHVNGAICVYDMLAVIALTADDLRESQRVLTEALQYISDKGLPEDAHLTGLFNETVAKRRACKMRKQQGRQRRLRRRLGHQEQQQQHDHGIVDSESPERGRAGGGETPRVSTPFLRNFSVDPRKIVRVSTRARVDQGSTGRIEPDVRSPVQPGTGVPRPGGARRGGSSRRVPFMMN